MGAKTGAVTAVQRASSDLRLNPHLHAVALDGAWYGQGGELCWEGLGYFKTAASVMLRCSGPSAGTPWLLSGKFSESTDSVSKVNPSKKGAILNDPILGVDLAEWQAKVAQWWRAFSRTFAVAFSNPKQLVMVQLEKQAKEESKKSLSPQSTQQQGEEGANKVLSQLAKQPEREGEYISPFLFVPSACAVGSLILRAAEGTMGVDQPFLPGPDYKARLDAFSGFLAFLASVAPGPVDPLTILSALP